MKGKDMLLLSRKSFILTILNIGLSLSFKLGETNSLKCNRCEGSEECTKNPNDSKECPPDFKYCMIRISEKAGQRKYSEYRDCESIKDDYFTKLAFGCEEPGYENEGVKDQACFCKGDFCNVLNEPIKCYECEGDCDENPRETDDCEEREQYCLTRAFTKTAGGEKAIVYKSCWYMDDQEFKSLENGCKARSEENQGRREQDCFCKGNLCNAGISSDRGSGVKGRSEGAGGGGNGTDSGSGSVSIKGGSVATAMVLLAAVGVLIRHYG